MKTDTVIAWLANGRWLFANLNGEHLTWTPHGRDATRMAWSAAQRWRRRLTGGDLYVQQP